MKSFLLKSVIVVGMAVCAVILITTYSAPQITHIGEGYYMCERVGYANALMCEIPETRYTMEDSFFPIWR